MYFGPRDGYFRETGKTWRHQGLFMVLDIVGFRMQKTPLGTTWRVLGAPKTPFLTTLDAISNRSVRIISKNFAFPQRGGWAPPMPSRILLLALKEPEQ
jgi:hypothetical protein